MLWPQGVDILIVNHDNKSNSWHSCGYTVSVEVFSGHTKSTISIQGVQIIMTQPGTTIEKEARPRR